MRPALAFLLTALLATAARADCPNLYVTQFGTTGAGAGQLNNPQRCATDRAGNVYVVDTGNSRIQKFSSAGVALGSFGGAGSANGLFNNPRAVAVDSLGNLYVADTNNNRVQKFSSAFAWQWSVGSLGSGAGQLNGAQGIALDPTGSWFYVAEYTNNRISKFTTAGVFVTSWASASVTDVTVDLAGNVYATAYVNNRVTKYTSAGVQLATWGTAGTGNGQFSGPQGIASDRYGNLYVCDSGNRRVQKFNTAGTFLAAFGSSGTGAGQFSDLFGVAVDTTGVVWVPDPATNHVSKWGAVPISLTLVAGPNPVYSAVTFGLSGRVAPTGASGLFYFTMEGGVIGNAVLSGGSAFLTAGPGIVPGSYHYALTYTGNGSCTGMSSPIVTEVINKSPTTVALAADRITLGWNETVTFTATVAVNLIGAAYTPTGTVQLLVDGVAYGSPVALSGGTATLSFAPGVGGTYAVTAVYSGDAYCTYSTNSGSPVSLHVSYEDPMPAPVLTWTIPGLYGSGPRIPPVALTTDPTNNVFVSDGDNGVLLGYTPAGQLFRWIRPGFGAMAVAFDPAGNLLLGYDPAGAWKYTSTGTYLGSWGPPSLRVTGFAFDAPGDVCVIDDNAHRVDRYTSDGSFATTALNNGSGTLRVARPTGITADLTQDIFVCDAGNQKVVWVGYFGIGEWSCPGDLKGIARDHAGSLYVILGAQKRIRKFDINGTLLGEIATPWQPTSIAIDGSDELYVSFSDSAYVSKYVVPQVVESVKDVPNDQGRAVRLKFSNSGADFASASVPVTGYQVYRQVSAAPGGAVQPLRAGHAAPNGVTMNGWDYVLTVPATADTVYNVVVPTLADSGAAGPGAQTFLVRAVTATPGLQYDSAPASGWSVDNLPPPTPAPFTATYAAGATHLHWAPSTASDFWYYRLYRGAPAAFVPGPGNIVATASDTGYVDAGAAGAYYKLTGVDVNGNESPAALAYSSGTTGVAPEGPLAFALERVRPNPSRGGSLRVECTLAAADRAAVELLDVAGRVVASRELTGTGRHTVDLAAGRRLPPGLYMLRLEQAGQSRTQRVVVLE
jgi:sugar lactone lactonase YvrE